MRFRILMIMGITVCLSAACTFSMTSAPSKNPEVEAPEKFLPTAEFDPVMEDQQPGDALSVSRAESPETDIPIRATSIADSPAAGICGGFEGNWVTITIYPEIPDPRCASVRPDQMLEVVNMREETLIVKIHYLEAEIPPGERHRFEIPFGKFLLPGVHQLSVQPCCGAELVLGE